MTDTDALRAALLDLLLKMPGKQLDTEEGRMQVSGEYWQASRLQHPAVADVLKEAAWKVRE